VDAIFEFWLKTSEQEDGVEALEGKKIKLKYVFFRFFFGLTRVNSGKPI
jgi:hypothetical protein